MASTRRNFLTTAILGGMATDPDFIRKHEVVKSL